MTPNALLLEKLANWRFDGGRKTLTVAEAAPGWSLAVEADCADRVGCRVWELTLTGTASPAADDLKARAERLSGRATGLLEPLRLVELDGDRRTALLRSAEPDRGGDDLFYYEVLLRDAFVSVRRYQASRTPGVRRTQTAFALTHDALVKLVGDLTAGA
jgi:hypothetical protein